MLGLMSRGYLCHTCPRVLLSAGPSIVSSTVYSPAVSGTQERVLAPFGTGDTLQPNVSGGSTSTVESVPTGTGGDLSPSIVSAKEE